MCRPELVAESGWFRSEESGTSGFMHVSCTTHVYINRWLLYINDVSSHILLFQWFYTSTAKFRNYVPLQQGFPVNACRKFQLAPF